MTAPAWVDDRRSPADRARAFFWSHPEWWCVAASALAWAAMVAHGVAHWGHAHHLVMSAGAAWLHWSSMVVAMMLPQSLGAVRTAAFRSLRARRHRAIAGFLAGYFAPWAALGALAVGLGVLPWTHTHAAAAAGFAFAAAWAATPQHARARIACHRTRPLAPAGLRADLDCIRFGASIGGACVASCWALMLACSVTGHALPAMLAGAAIGAFEQAAFRPRSGPVVAAIAALAAGYALAAIPAR